MAFMCGKCGVDNGHTEDQCRIGAVMTRDQEKGRDHLKADEDVDDADGNDHGSSEKPQYNGVRKNVRFKPQSRGGYNNRGGGRGGYNNRQGRNFSPGRGDTTSVC